MAATRAMQTGRSTVYRAITAQIAAERQVDARLRLAAALTRTRRLSPAPGVQAALMGVQEAAMDLMAATYVYSEAIEAKAREG